MKPKVAKKSKAEKAIEKATGSFLEFQKEVLQREEERWNKEIELEERRRQEDRDHEMRMFEMLQQMMQPHYPYTNMFD